MRFDSDYLFAIHLRGLSHMAHGMGDEAMELFHMINPLNHTRTRGGVERYRAEPYAVAHSHITYTGHGAHAATRSAAGEPRKVTVMSRPASRRL